MFGRTKKKWISTCFVELQLLNLVCLWILKMLRNLSLNGLNRIGDHDYQTMIEGTDQSMKYCTNNLGFECLIFLHTGISHLTNVSIAKVRYSKWFYLGLSHRLMKVSSLQGRSRPHNSVWWWRNAINFVFSCLCEDLFVCIDCLVLL